MPELVATTSHDFQAERSRLLALLEEFGTRDLAACAFEHAGLGPMSGKDSSRLQAKHLDHHLRQFGA
jgi:hypothetical protein